MPYTDCIKYTATMCKVSIVIQLHYSILLSMWYASIYAGHQTLFRWDPPIYELLYYMCVCGPDRIFVETECEEEEKCTTW